MNFNSDKSTESFLSYTQKTICDFPGWEKKKTLSIAVHYFTSCSQVLLNDPLNVSFYVG